MESISSIRETITREGIDWLRIDHLDLADIPHISWSGNRNHLKTVAKQLRSTKAADTLVVRTPFGTVLSKAYVDHTTSDDASTIGQLATHPDLQSCGIGTKLIVAAESTMVSLGKSISVLGVETENVRAMELYIRLGYEPQHLEMHHWEVTGADGELHPYEAEVQIMCKTIENRSGQSG